MSAKTGEEFIKHEFDEAIAIQQSIVDAEAALAETHPVGSAKQRSSGPEARREVPPGASDAGQASTARRARSRTSPAASRS